MSTIIMSGYLIYSYQTIIDAINLSEEGQLEDEYWGEPRDFELHVDYTEEDEEWKNHPLTCHIDDFFSLFLPLPLFYLF